MKILINASNLVIGGGIQVGVWFITKCIDNKIDAYFAVSEKIHAELIQNNVSIDQDRIKIFKQSPARSKSSRWALLKYSASVQPDAIFTVFGPAYVNFPYIHICGFADGWLSHASFSVYKKVFKGNWFGACQLLLSSIYKAIKIRQADAWIFEAQVAADGLAKRAYLPKHNCFVVPNNCAERFTALPIVSGEFSGLHRFLYFTADYLHKGIANYLSYASELVKLAPELDFVFVITIDAQSVTAKNILEQAKPLRLERYFNFCGYVSIEHSVALLDSANIVMQTSYLETFSANYPEAMARQRPLLVSHFDFARDICQEAALYVEPDDAKQVAQSLLNLCRNEKLAQKQIEAGKQVLAELPDSDERFEAYMKIIKRIIKNRSQTCVA